MPYDPRGKIQIIKNTEALPAKCVVCHKPVDGNREFVDFGFDIDFYGQVLFCVDCMRPVAEACDYIPYEEFKKLSDVLEISLDRGKELEADRDNIRDLLDGLLGYKSSVAVSPEQLDVSESEELEDSSGNTEPADSTTVGTEPDIDESDSESGQRDVPETPSHTEPKPNGSSGIQL